MTVEQQYFDTIGKELNMQAGQLFGKPCFKINGKAFICFFQNEMVFKLSGNIHQEAISLDKAQLFDPSGKKRPMKEWVQVPALHKQKWKEFALAALAYVDRP